MSETTTYAEDVMRHLEPILARVTLEQGLDGRQHHAVKAAVLNAFAITPLPAASAPGTPATGGGDGE